MPAVFSLTRDRKGAGRERARWRLLYERCCGLDVHKRTVVACLLTPASGGAADQGAAHALGP